MILAIDASTKSTGYAIFNNDKELIEYGLLTASGNDLIKRIKKIIEQLDVLLAIKDIDKIVMEEVIPESGKTNATYKALMYLQAHFVTLLHDKYPKLSIEFVIPGHWRKQCGIKGKDRKELKKADIEFVNSEYKQALKELLSYTQDDIADAIGIGHGYLSEEDEFFSW